jgi:membrane protease YdiL (CAAX protease family)
MFSAPPRAPGSLSAVNPSDEPPGFPPVPLPGEGPPALPVYDVGPEALGRVPWRWWEPIVVFLLTLVTSTVVGLLANVVITAGVDCGTPLSVVPSRAAYRCDVGNAIFIAIFEIALGAWALLWPKIRWNASARTLGLTSDRLGSNIRVGFAAGAIGFVVGVVVVGLVAQFVVDLFSTGPVEAPQQLPFEGTPHWLALVITGVSVIVFAPVAEELFFRGFLYQALRRRLSLVGAGIVSALIFGAAHMQPPFGIALLLLIPSITALGFILAWVFERRSSLVPSITAHALFNSIGFSIYLISLAD